MKILMLTPYLPYPDSSGGQIRTLNLLKHLCKTNEITLFSLIKDQKENDNIKHLLKYCRKVVTFERSKSPWTLKNILKTGFSQDPFLIVRNSADGVKQAVINELESEKYDLIHAETFYVMQHIPQTNLPVVLVDQTIEYLVYQHYVNHTAHPLLKPLLQIDVEKLKASERANWKRATQVVAVSEADKVEMNRLDPELDIKIVPNGVNLDLFKKKTNWDSKNPVVLFVSNFKWLQNIEATHLLINKVFPLVKKQIPSAKLRIVGQHIPQDIINKSSDSLIVDSISEEDVQSVVDAMYESSVFASTIKGPGGTRLKNLAAMASQLPIVSTKVGVEGLSVENNVHVLIGNSNLAIAQKILKVIKSPALAEKIAKSARKHVEKNFDYANIAKLLDDIYKNSVKNEDNQ